LFTLQVQKVREDVSAIYDVKFFEKYEAKIASLEEQIGALQAQMDVIHLSLNKLEENYAKLEEGTSGVAESIVKRLLDEFVKTHLLVKIEIDNEEREVPLSKVFKILEERTTHNFEVLLNHIRRIKSR
jgi:RNA-binding protein YhbY